MDILGRLRREIQPTQASIDNLTNQTTNNNQHFRPFQAYGSIKDHYTL